MNQITNNATTYFRCGIMSDEALPAIHKKLTDDKKLSIDFDEYRFKQEMEKAKEVYRNR